MHKTQKSNIYHAISHGLVPCGPELQAVKTRFWGSINTLCPPLILRVISIMKGSRLSGVISWDAN